MKRAFLTLLLIPSIGFALDFSDRSLTYTDAPFKPGEAAGISLLTSIDAVAGNPDGSFRPNRTLNRAEFLKIALQSHPDVRVSSSDAASCFPDVSASDWFAKYVCLAKKRNVIAGYPDGTFKPANSVNYAEALKILGELYNYTAYAEPDAPWYALYAQAALNHKVSLPISIAYDRPLSRGQMARLAAAYRAEHEGELEAYRDAEIGRLRIPVVKKLEEAEQELEENIQESEDEESSDEIVEEGDVEKMDIEPVRSRLLHIGAKSKAIADGRFMPHGDDVYVRIVKVQLWKEIKSIKELYLLTENGKELGTLTLDVADNDKETWRTDFAKEDEVLLQSGERTVLRVAARLKDRGDGGVPEELVQVKAISLIVQEIDAVSPYELVPSATTFPAHQTVVGSIKSVESVLREAGTFHAGRDRLLGSFSFAGYTTDAIPLQIEHLTFDISMPFGIAVNNVELGSSSINDRHPCSIENKARINCSGIPNSLGSLSEGGHTLELYGNITIGAAEEGSTFQVSLRTPGTVGSQGSVRWTDGSGHYTWLELDEPVAEGPLWEVR